MNENWYDESTIKHNLKDLEKQIDAEKEKEKVDGSKITKLRFAQLMQGLYLQNIY